MSDKRGWYGVDLDGTLAEYHGWVEPDHIGPPIAAMVDRIKGWLGQGYGVRIVTARAFNADQATIDRVQDWTELHIGHRLPVTCQKDYGMIQLWDDRAVQVIGNTGIQVSRAEPTPAQIMADPRVQSLVEAARKMLVATDLREIYHRLPNDKNRIGDPKSPKAKARDAWLKAFRRASSATSLALAAIKELKT